MVKRKQDEEYQEFKKGFYEQFRNPTWKETLQYFLDKQFQEELNKVDQPEELSSTPVFQPKDDAPIQQFEKIDREKLTVREEHLFPIYNTFDINTISK